MKTVPWGSEKHRFRNRASLSSNPCGIYKKQKVLEKQEFSEVFQKLNTLVIKLNLLQLIH